MYVGLARIAEIRLQPMERLTYAKLAAVEALQAPTKRLAGVAFMKFHACLLEIGETEAAQSLREEVLAAGGQLTSSCWLAQYPIFVG